MIADGDVPRIRGFLKDIQNNMKIIRSTVSGMDKYIAQRRFVSTSLIETMSQL